MSARFAALALTIALAATIPCAAADTTTWAGMTLSDPTAAQLTEIENAYGEGVGVMVLAVTPDSQAATTCILAGDTLICVRMPDDTDWYPITDLEEMATWGPDNAPSDNMRLLVLRKAGAQWQTLKGWLGKPFGTAVDEGVLGGGKDMESHPQGEGDVSAQNFLSSDPSAVLATAPDQAQLTQQDVNIYCGIMAWAFGTTLTESQTTITRDALIEFWQQAPPGLTHSFAQGVRPVPVLMPQLNDVQRESMRQQYAGTLWQMAQGMPQHPLGQVIIQVATQANQALAGAETQWPFTQQDADAMIEYLSFQLQVTSGVPVFVSDAERAQITQMLVTKYNAASDAEKQTMSLMDQYWAALRVQWALAQQQAQQQMQQQPMQQAGAAQQPQYQSQVQSQWMDQLHQQYPPGNPFWQGYNQMDQWSAQRAAENPGGGGSGMTPGMMNVYQNMIDMDNQTSMGIINNMGAGPTTDVYDPGGAFMYSY